MLSHFVKKEDTILKKGYLGCLSREYSMLFVVYCRRGDTKNLLLPFVYQNLD